MNNPYKVLNIPQDATKEEIIKGKILAMKEKRFSLQEIQMAEKQLLTPARRLVADFMFPSKIKAKRPRLIVINVEPENFDLSKIDTDKFNSL
jgi:hypothetical protein